MISTINHPLLPRAVAQTLSVQEYEEFLRVERELMARLQPQSEFELHQFVACFQKLITKKVEPQ